MDKKIYTRLVAASLSNDKLDEKKVLRIAEKLDRKQLKLYLDALKKWLRLHTIVIESARDVSDSLKKEFQKHFEDKQIVFRKNPDLLVGIRIIDNDMIYEMNLKDSLESIKDYVTR